MCIPNKPVYVQRRFEATTLAFNSSRLLNSILYWHDNNSQYSNLYEHEQDTQTPDQIDSSNLQQQVTTVTPVSDSGIHVHEIHIGYTNSIRLCRTKYTHVATFQTKFSMQYLKEKHCGELSQETAQFYTYSVYIWTQNWGHKNVITVWVHKKLTQT